MRRRVFVLGSVLSTLSTAATAGQPWQDYLSMELCSEEPDSTKRLSCYDKTFPTLKSDVDSAGKLRAGEIYEWRGNGSTHLTPFQMTGAWMLRWSSTSDISIEIDAEVGDGAAATPVDTAQSSATESGSSYMSRKGVFSLGVIAIDGDWTIRAEPA